MSYTFDQIFSALEKVLDKDDEITMSQDQIDIAIAELEKNDVGYVANAFALIFSN